MKKHNLIFTILLAVMMAFTACTEDENDSYTETGSITIISPANGDNWQIGTEQVIRWSDDLTENVMIHLYQGNSLIQPINTSASGTEYTWTVPTHLPTGTNYKIRIGSTITAEVYDESNYFEISDYGRSDFAAKWIVESGIKNNKDKKSLNSLHFTKDAKNPYELYNSKGSPNLIPYKPDTWDDKIVIKNTYTEGDPDPLNDDLISTSDNKLYIGVSYKNSGDEDINQAIKTAIYIDDVEVRVIDYGEDNPLLSGYYRRHWNYSVNDVSLSEGTHTIKMIVDYDNQITESNENDNEYSRTFTVSGPSAIYESFEFVESRYFIKKTDGSSVIGALIANNNELTLSDFGTISIISINDYNISFELTLDKKTTASTINAYKSAEIASTAMTDMLTYDPWVLVTSSHSTPDIGGKWTFTPSNTYWFEYANGTVYEKGWDYVNETTISYGSYGGPYNGSATINEISNTHLKISDDFGYNYEFER